VELEGRIGRPELKEVNGKCLFTAGLGIAEGNDTRWVSITAWGHTAELASTLRRGQIVRVVGKSKDNRYLDSGGVMQVRTELVISAICPVEHVGSAIIPSRASAKSIM
jgi:single-stranded DNA-binding protein